MSNLQSFPDDLRVAVIGSNGGIGSALVRRLGASPRVATVFSLARGNKVSSDGNIRTAPIDTADEQSVRDAARLVAESGPLDIVLVATGMLHQAQAVRPEKSMREIDADAMMTVLRTNTIGPTLVAKHFLPLMRRSEKSVFAALSARVGSISDNRLGGWTSYRASKAALNMVLKTLSIEHARRFPDSVVAGLHPGTVDTRLSQPFQRNVPEGKLFSSDQAAGYLLDVIDGLTPDDSGRVFAWDGARIDY